MFPRTPAAIFHGFSGNHAEAAGEVRVLLDLAPNFAPMVQDECRIWTSNPEIIEVICEGLRIAGMVVSEQNGLNRDGPGS